MILALAKDDQVLNDKVAICSELEDSVIVKEEEQSLTEQKQTVEDLEDKVSEKISDEPLVAKSESNEEVSVTNEVTQSDKQTEDINYEDVFIALK